MLCLAGASQPWVPSFSNKQEPRAAAAAAPRRAAPPRRPGQRGWAPGGFCPRKAPYLSPDCTVTYVFLWLAGWMGKAEYKDNFLLCLHPAEYDFVSVFLPRLWEVETVHYILLI